MKIVLSANDEFYVQVGSVCGVICGLLYTLGGLKTAFMESYVSKFISKLS